MQNFFYSIESLFEYFKAILSNLGQFLSYGVKANAYLFEVLALLPQYFVSVILELAILFIILMLVNRG